MPGAFRFTYRWPDIATDVLRPDLTDERYGLPPVTQDTINTFLAHQEVRDKELEDFLGTSTPLVWNLSGALVTSFSPTFYAMDATSFRRHMASLQTTGTGDTTIDVIRNGTVMGTLTIPSGAHVSPVGNVQVGLAAQVDYIQYHVTAFGSGAADLIVESAS